MTHAERPAVLCLSGGLDSTTVLAIARAQGFAVHCLAFDYGQRHRVELQAARGVAAAGAASFTVVPIDLRAFGGSALTADIAVPKGRSPDEMEQGVPVTYVPARNTIFLAYALAVAEVRGAADLFVGVNQLDYSGYPDCRPAFIAAFQALANVATKAAVQDGRALTIHAPLMHMNKAAIIREGVRLGVDYAATWSCYEGLPAGACGACDACILRAKGFAEAGVPDPTKYASAGA